MEACNTFKATYNEGAGKPRLTPERSRCKHLYFYYDHEDYGFMSIRLQTWAPYEIQISLNGREWLKRLLDKSNSGYMLEGNKFLDFQDYGLAQKLLNSRLDTRWIPMLTDFTARAFPSMPELLGERMEYYWTQWQSEWAKDYIFKDPQELQFQMGSLLRHAFLTGTSERVLRYMGKPIKDDGQPKWGENMDLSTRLKSYYDGGRIKHWLNQNSVKLYNEQNVLRFECTINDPTQFESFKIRVHKM